MDEAEVTRIYGGWAARTPRDAADLLADYPGRWFVAGGWAIEAFTGVARPHGDLDVGVLRRDLPLLRRHLAGRLDAWVPVPPALVLLAPDDRPDEPFERVLPEDGEQLWLRAGGDQPWQYDVLLTPGTEQEWVFKRDPGVRLPWARAVWRRDGVDHLAPEVQLLHKARALRDKDRADLEATLPHLDRSRRAWLRSALGSVHPEHPWIPRLA